PPLMDLGPIAADTPNVGRLRHHHRRTAQHDTRRLTVGKWGCAPPLASCRSARNGRDNRTSAAVAWSHSGGAGCPRALHHRAVNQDSDLTIRRSRHRVVLVTAGPVLPQADEREAVEDFSAPPPITPSRFLPSPT